MTLMSQENVLLHLNY